MLTIYRPRTPRLSRSFRPAGYFDEEAFPERVEEVSYPRVEIKQSAGNYVLTAELPGMDKDDIHIDVDNGVLTLRGERRSAQEEELGRCDCSEIFYGSFERSFDLPTDARVDEIHAHLDKGILTITVPSSGHESRKVEVAVH